MLDLGSAVGYLTLDTSGFKKGFGEANSYLKSFLDSSGTLADRMSSLEKGFTSIGKSLSVGVSLPLIGVGTAMVHFAADAESALKKFKAQVGETTVSLEKYKEIMDDVYSSNYGESYEDVADSMATIVKLMGEMDPSAMQETTEAALTLRDTLGYDVPESVRAANALMQNFGLTAEQAFDFIVKGNQEGLDYSNELLDTISEYSVQFKKVGFDAEDMFSILKEGTESGAWNLDKVGDAIKEFSIRAVDSSDSTIEAFEKLGISYEDIGKRFAEGGDAARAAFMDTVSAIESIQDPLEQDLVGVALFGTMWEDLGKEVVFQMGQISDEALDMSGAMDTLKETRFDTLEGSIGNLWRTIQSAGASLGETFIPVVNNLANMIQGLVEGFKNLDPHTKDFVTNLGLALAILGPMLLVMGKITGAVNSGIAAYQSLKTALTSATAAQTGLNAAMASNVIGLVITAVGGLVAVLASFGIASALTATEVSRLTDEIEEARSAYEELDNEIETNNSNTMAMVATLEQLVQKENKTVAEKQAIKDLVADLNESVPELSLAYDEQTESLNMTTEAIRKAAKAEYERAKQQAIIDRMSEAYTEQIRIAEELEEAQAQLEKEQQRYSEAMENSTAKTTRQKDQMYAYSGALIGAQGEVDRLTALQDQNAAEIAELEAAYGYYANVTMADARQASIELVNQSGKEKIAIDATTDAVEAKVRALLALAKADVESAKAAMGQAGVDPLAAAMSVGKYTKAAAEVAAYTKALEDLANAKSAAKDDDDNDYGTGTGTGGTTTYERAKDSVDLYREAIEKLDHERAMDLISDEEYYKKKNELGKKYLEKGSSEQMALEEELYEWEKEKQEEQLKARTELYKSQRDALKEAYEDQEITTEEYLSKLYQLQTEYLDEGTDAWVSAMEFRNSEIERLQEEFVDTFTDSLDEIGDRYEDALSDLENAQDDLARKLASTGDLFEVADDKMTLGNLQEDIDQINAYGEALEALRDRGVSQSLLDEILGLDVDEATDYMGKLLQMTEEDFAEYNALWGEKQKAAKDIAEQFYKEQLDTLETEFADELTSAMEGVPDDMELAGQEAAEAWLMGFETEFTGVLDRLKGLFSEASLLGSGAAGSFNMDLRTLPIQGSYASGLDYVPRDMNVRVHQGESIWTKQQTADLANLLGDLVNPNQGGDLIINFIMNGTTFSRAIIHDFRAVDTATPKVVSDFGPTNN